MNKISYLVRLFGQGRSSILSLAVVSLLTACGGGGGGGGDPAPLVNAIPTGYYGNNGTARVFAEDNTTPIDIADLQGMIHNGRLVMLSAAQGLSYDGAITVSGDTYLGTLTAYRNGTKLTTAPVTGSINQGVSVTGTLSGAGANNGSFTLSYAGNNEEAAALSVVAGATNAIWSAPIGGGDTIFRMDINGTNGNILDDFPANDGLFRSCAMAGAIAPITGTHLYTVSVALTNCFTPASNGATYTGLATTRTQTPGGANNRLVFAVSNDSFSVNAEFTR